MLSLLSRPRHPLSSPRSARRALFAVFAAASLSACGGGGDTPTQPGGNGNGTPKGPDPVLKGSMFVTVTGISAPATADLIITGPGGFSRTLTGSGAFSDIDAGRYVVTARTVRTPEGALEASPTEQNVDIIGGQPPASATVNYGPALVTVGVVVDGLPSGASAAVTLVSPAGTGSNLSASSRVKGVAGRWTISATPVKSGGFTYAPTPANAELPALPGDSIGFRVGHAVSTGAVAVVVSGLPAGASATYTLTGAGITPRTATGTATITDLAPGTYTIAAPPVDATGSLYRPATPTQTFVVSASLVATPVTIAYAPITSTLIVSVAGAPSGATDMVRVSGPNGFNRLLSASSTLSGIAPGAYTVSSTDIVTANATWRAANASTQRTLAGDDTATVAVAYAVATGSLAVTVTGLPGTSSGAVTVSGPGGYTRSVTSSTTLFNLAPGAYTVVASSVNAGTDSYNGSPSPQTVNVAASLSSATATVTYRVRAAAIVVRIDGAPGNAQEMVRVTGPGGFERALTTTTTLEGLVPGPYFIEAIDIVQPSAVWRANPSTFTRTLALDARDTIDVNYAVTTGMIAVTISGLPTGVNGNMQLSGPNGYLAPVTGTNTFVRLVPGTYALAGSAVSSGGATYTPSPATQQITVNPSLQAAGANVSYGNTTNPNNAVLVVAVMGAPNGGSPSVQVTGPSNYSRTVTSTTTITALAPGSYTVVPASFASGGSTYTPTPSSAQRSLTTGGRDSVGITYSTSTPPATTGQLAVTVSGLPAGVNAAIQLTGSSTNTSITGSTTVTGLNPGSYTLAASSVTNSGTTYNPSPTSQNPTVSAGATSNATVTYASAAPPTGDDLSVEFAYVTQATQRPDGSVPLVASRDALLRVFVKNSRTNVLRPDVRVRIYEGATLLQTTTIMAPELSVRTATAEGTLASTWNTVIPAANVRPNLRILADVDPTSAVTTDPDRTNNIWPRSATPQAVTVNTAPALNIRFVPVTVGALTGNVTAGNMGSFLTTSRLVHPISTVNADVRLAFTSSATVLQSGDGNSAWLTVLSEMNTLRSSDAAPSNMHYYGVVKVSYTSGVAGYGFVPGRAAVGWDYLPSGDGVAVHELGHNFSRPHSPCGVSGDASYPYSGGTIGYYGWNSTSNSLIQTNATDYMGYCNNTWTSDWTWNAVMNYRASSGFVSAASVAGAESAIDGEGLLVWGRIVDGKVMLEPAFRVKAPASPRATSAQYRVEALDGNGAPLLDIPIDAPRVDHVFDHEERQFAVVLPWTATLEASLASVRVRDVRSPLLSAMRSSEVARDISRRVGARPAAARIQNALPDPVASVARAGGRDRLTWNSARYSMAMVKDVATGQVIAYLRNPGDQYQPRSREVELVLSDGVRSIKRRVAPLGQPE